MNRREAMIAFGLSLGSLAWGPLSRPALQLPKRKLLRAGMWIEISEPGSEDRRFFLEEGVDHGRFTFADLGMDPAKSLWLRSWGALEGQSTECLMHTGAVQVQFHYNRTADQPPLLTLCRA